MTVVKFDFDQDTSEEAVFALTLDYFYMGEIKSCFDIKALGPIMWSWKSIVHNIIITVKLVYSLFSVSFINIKSKMCHAPFFLIINHVYAVCTNKI